jgi:hypothetical protein
MDCTSAIFHDSEPLCLVQGNHHSNSPPNIKPSGAMPKLTLCPKYTRRKVGFDKVLAQIVQESNDDGEKEDIVHR